MGRQPLPQVGQTVVKDVLIPHLRQFVPQAIPDLLQRCEIGRQEYGRDLETHNGRNGAKDLLDEALDACMYAQQLVLEATNETARSQAQLALSQAILLTDIAHTIRYGKANYV